MLSNAHFVLLDQSWRPSGADGGDGLASFIFVEYIFFALLLEVIGVV